MTIITIVWIVGGILIFEHRFELLSFFYRLTLSLPEPGTQKPARAFAFVDQALEPISDEKIDLDRMAASCPKKSERSFQPDSEFFRTDWLQEYLQKKSYTEDTNLTADTYWMQYRQTVSTSLHYLLEATLYAFEIPSSVSQKEDILLPDLIDKFSAAMCNPYPALRTWGRYVDFQEQRAYKVLLESEANLELQLPFRPERELLVLSTLKNRGEYIRALRQYAAGSVPSDSNEDCNDFRLVCIAVDEASHVTDKLIYVSPKDRLGMLYLNHARIYLRTNKEGDTDRAINRFAGAIGYPAVEVQARLELGNLFVSLGRFNEAYSQLQTLDVIMGPNRLRNAAFRLLARRVLTGTGRFVEADCFSDEAQRSEKRPGCIDLKL